MKTGGDLNGLLEFPNLLPKQQSGNEAMDERIWHERILRWKALVYSQTGCRVLAFADPFRNEQTGS